jgi:hypothetical protein
MVNFSIVIIDDNSANSFKNYDWIINNFSLNSNFFLNIVNADFLFNCDDINYCDNDYDFILFFDYFVNDDAIMETIIKHHLLTNLD